jgi:hypothetical protein
MNCDCNRFSKVPIENVKDLIWLKAQSASGSGNAIDESGQIAAFTWRVAQVLFTQFIFSSFGLPR